jgi:hypothetical protein
MPSSLEMAPVYMCRAAVHYSHHTQKELRVGALSQCASAMMLLRSYMVLMVRSCKYVPWRASYGLRLLFIVTEHLSDVFFTQTNLHSNENVSIHLLAPNNHCAAIIYLSRRNSPANHREMLNPFFQNTYICLSNCTSTLPSSSSLLNDTPPS